MTSVDTVDAGSRHDGSSGQRRPGAGHAGEVGEGDTITTMERIPGGSGDDRLTGGSTKDDILIGNAGADRRARRGRRRRSADTTTASAAHDLADGGIGVDTAFTDPGEVMTNVP